MKQVWGHTVRTAVVVSTLLATALVVSPPSVVEAAAPTPVVIRVGLSNDTCVGTITTGFDCSLANGVALANLPDYAGSTIRLAPSRYELTSPLTLTKNDTKVIGAELGNKAAAYVIDAKGGKGFIIDADGVRITGITITNAGNSNGNGGAILVKRNRIQFRLVDSSIENSSAREGGGVYVDGSAVIDGSTFVGNSADRKGGAVRVAGSVEIVNSTFTENTAQSGGAISVAGVAAISFSTFVDNTSNNQKGGGVDRNGGSLFVTGSILTEANKISADGSDCSGNPDLIGPNYVGNSQGCQPGASVLVGSAVGIAGLGVLGDYLGPTRTIPLATGSVVADKADSTSCGTIGLSGSLASATLAVDQRDIVRPQGAACDLGAYEIAPLQVGLQLGASTDTPYVGARFLPGSAISQSVVETDALFDGSLSASPLNAFPLETAPLNAFPLNAFPLNAFPLNAFPLNAFTTLEAFALAEAPLNAFPLNAFPLNAFPLNAFPLNAFPLSDLVLTDDTWDRLLEGTAYEGVPLQSLTLGDVIDEPSVQGISLGSINLEGTPLSAFPLSAFLLGSIPLNAFPLNAFGTGITDLCQVAELQALCAGGVNPSTDDDFTLASAAIAGLPLNAFPLNAFPLNAFFAAAAPLNAFPLETVPLNAFPLNAFAWRSSPLNAFPLNAFPLNAFPLNAFAKVIDCSDPQLVGGCENATLLDVYEAGAFVDGANLGDLGSLFTTYLNDPVAGPKLLAALGGYSVADLISGAIPSESIAWNEVDLTVPGIQNAAPADKWTFQYLADLSLTAPAAVLDVHVTLPPGFAYVPGGTRLDGVTVADPTLSCSGGSCVDETPDVTTGETVSIAKPITLTFHLFDVRPGNRVLAIDTRAGFELGKFTATATASAKATPTDGPVLAGPSTKDVTVTAPDDATGGPILIETSATNPCSADGSGDVNLGWVAPSTDGIDLYKFDISAAAAACGVRADIFLSNLPADYDVVLYGEKSDPLRGEPVESIAYLDDVTLDLNPFDDIVQADSVQDIPQVLNAAGVDGAAYAVDAISSNRARGDERIRTGTLREGTYYIQVSSYNGAEANTPYALRLRTDGTVARGACAALPYPGVGSTANITPLSLPPIDGTLPSNLNTLFIVNSQLLEYTYGPNAADSVLAAAGNVAAAATAGVVGAILPVDADSTVRAAYRARAADPCNPELSNDIVRAIGDVIDAYTQARPGIEYIVILGDDRQVPMANIVDDANYANERTFAQEFAGNNESIAALAAGMYRSDDPYGTDAGIRIRDHELFAPTRAVGRLGETPTEIKAYLDNFVAYDGQLDPDTETRTALETGYEFLADGAELNAVNLEKRGYTVETTVDVPGNTVDLIGEKSSWTDGDLVAALDRGATEPHLDVIGINAHFDEDNALPAYDNFNPPVSNEGLFNSRELPSSVRRAVVYSMGCHSGYSLSDIQVGFGPTTDVPDGWSAQFPVDSAPDWAQALTGGRTNTFIGNSGFGYGDTDTVALTEQLTAIFADEVGKNGAIGQAWVDAKQRMLSEILVLDAYQEKALQQFVFYGLPMFHIGTPPVDLSGTASIASQSLAALGATAAPDTDPTGQPIATVEFRRSLPMDPGDIPQFDLVSTDDGSYYGVSGRTMRVNGHPVQPLYAQDVPSYDGLAARDALITELTTRDAPTPFDPLFFWASPNFGGPRPEFMDGSFPAEMASVRSYSVRGQKRQQVLIAAGQYRGSSDNPDSGTQRLHTRVGAEVYYSNSSDFTPPAIARSVGQVDSDAIQFDIDVDDTAQRVYVLYRATGVNTWTGVDLVKRSATSWRGVGPFSSASTEPSAEYIVQAVDDHGNIAMSNSKSWYFLASAPGDVSALRLEATGDTIDPDSGWFTGNVTVEAIAGDLPTTEYRVDAGPFADYAGPFFLSDSGTPVGVITVASGAHVVSAFDGTGAFAATIVKIDSIAPIPLIFASAAGWTNGSVTVTISADDGNGSGISSLEYSTDGGLTWKAYTVPFPFGVTGETTIKARATDVAGNQSPAVETTVQIDVTPPEPSISASTTEWTNQPVTVAITADDGNGSGVAMIEYSTDDGATWATYGGEFPFDTEGVTKIMARATDVVGNRSASVDANSVTVRVDVTPPLVPILDVAPTVALGHPISADYSCGDLLSGIASCELFVAIGTGPFALVDSNRLGATDIPLPSDALGEYTVRVAALDQAENTLNSETTYVVSDDTPPTAWVELDSASVRYGEGNSATFGCSDNESGVASCTLELKRPGGQYVAIATDQNQPVTLPTDDVGRYDIRVTAVDGAGNIGTASGSYDVTDNTLPTVNITPNPTSGTWYSTVPVLGSISASDGLGSGVATLAYTMTNKTTGVTSTVGPSPYAGPVNFQLATSGKYTVTAIALDRSGNSGTATVMIDIDTQPPTATLTLSASEIEAGGTVTPQNKVCLDSLSGIRVSAGCVLEVKKDAGVFVELAPASPLPNTAGNYQVRARATDNAGNVAYSPVRSYVVLKTLCVNPLYDPNQAKNIGSNYTIKIELTDCAGTNLSSKAVVLTAFQISDSRGTIYAPGANDSGDANDLFQFRYSNREGYIYNLNTTGYTGPPGRLTLDFRAVKNGVVLGVGHAPFTVS